MSTFNCPSCGRQFKVIPLSGSGGDGWQRGQPFATGAPPAGSEYSRETPMADMSTTEAAVKVPLLQAVITAIMVAVMAIVGVWFWDWPSIVPLAAGILAGGLTWWITMTANRGLLSVVERITGQDEPERVAAHEVRVEITDTDKGQMRFAQFPAKRGQVEQFALAVLNGQTAINGRRGGLSQGVFTRLRDESIDSGLLRWKSEHSHNQGVELSRKGEVVFTHLLDV